MTTSKPQIKNRKKLLSSSRPPSTKSPHPIALSSKSTRSVISTHHTLLKQLSTARLTQNHSEISSLERKIQQNGGLERYQAASTTGQGKERGGDSSRVLVGWLRDAGVLPTQPGKHFRKGSTLQNEHTQVQKEDKGKRKLRVLEIGSLSPSNALSLPETNVRRIDLRSTHADIEKGDFLEMDPEEEWKGERGYDVLSLSLVVNYVGDAGGRGRMLGACGRFLRSARRMGGVYGGEGGDEDVRETTPSPNIPDEQIPSAHNTSNPSQPSKTSHHQNPTNNQPNDLLPSLFLVLPLSCVDNSRYMTETHLTDIMESLGYVRVRVKRSGKLFYSLWRYTAFSEDYGDSIDGRVKRGKGVQGGTGRRRKIFKKEELRSGKDRNNFCIILDDAEG